MVVVVARHCSRQTFQEVVKMSSAFGRVRTIAKKELVEFVRDWRTILAILVIPLLLFPILFILFPLLLASEAAELNAINVDVVVQADDVPDDLESMLDNASLNLTYEPLPEVEELSAPLGEDDRLRNGSIDALLRLRQNGTVLEYAFLYLSTSEQSLEARSRMFRCPGCMGRQRDCSQNCCSRTRRQRDVGSFAMERRHRPKRCGHPR